MSFWPFLSTSTSAGAVRFDRAAPVRLGATPIEVRPDGYKVYRGVATYGDVVLKYPEFGRNEFRPAAEVLSPEAVASMVGVPFTLHHPDDLLDAADPSALKDAAEGVVVAARVDPKSNPPSLVVDVVLWTRDAQDAVESGRLAELSPGYRCEDTPAPAGASHMGEGYQVIQRGHRYNHLSGVLSARTVLPDGRRARLDEARVSAPYARGDMDDLFTDQSADDPTATRTDAEASAPDEAEKKDAPVDEVVESVEVEADLPIPAAEALAAFTPEDAAILKTLTPEGLALLASMAKQMAAEAAEQAVMAAPAGAEVEVETDATAVAREKESIGETMKGAAKAVEAEVGKDATVPMAPQGLTADAVNAMIADAIAKAMAPKAAAVDASACAPKKDAVTPAARAVVDQAAVAAKIAESRKMDAEFIGVARRDGHVDERASVKVAATAMYGVIVEHLPKLASLAKTAIVEGRRDSFLQIYEQAEEKRRNGLIDDQQSIFAEFQRGPAGNDGSPADAAAILSLLGRPAAG